MNQLETKLPQWMNTAVVPGLSVAIIEDSELSWQGAFGVANKETGEAVTDNTVFQAASLSKPVFAYAVLKLSEEGRLDLDRPLMQYLPSGYQPAEIAIEPTLQQITARHVLSHQTGFPNWPGDDKLLRNAFPPGTWFGYSGAAYHFLQEVVAHLSGQASEAWMQARLLRPLQMRLTSYTATADDGRHLARGHDEEGGVAPFREIPEMGAGYSLHSTAVDLARFLCACLRPSPANETHLRPATLEAMLTPQIQVNDVTCYREGWPDLNAPVDPLVAWGLGWGLQETAHGRAFWHWGDNGVFKTFAIGYPGSGDGLVMMSNGQNGNRLWRPLLEAVFDADQPCLAWLDRAYG